LATFIDGITRGAARLQGVIDAMVDVSLIETGGLVLHLSCVPVGYVLQGAIHAVQPAVQQRNMTLTVQDMTSLPPIEADVALLDQVFRGLLSNAIKYSPDGSEIVVSGRLALGLDASDEASSEASSEGAVEILVADAGIGVDPDQQAVIFEKFYRPESPLQHSTDPVRFKGAGPGLGLAIAKGIVVAHKGRIWVESKGRDEERCPGSTFYVRLPVAPLSQEVVDA
ncbi:MAG: sensor histidine kinase, partial [Anaerolineae bacterium]